MGVSPNLVVTLSLEATRQADAELMERVASRQELAFEEFVQATALSVVRAVFNVLRNKAIADEVVQEVYLEAWRIAHRYQPELGSARTWITVIARRRAIDRVRREQSSVSREAAYVSALDLLDLLDPADIAVHAEDHVRLYRALHGLSDVQRTALALAYFYGYTQSEMATFLGVPLGTVKTRVRDGLKRIRELI